MRAWLMVLFVSLVFLADAELLAQKKSLDLGPVTEKHVMIPARDGVGLSAYLYIPRGKGPWPVIYEQRYQSVRSDGARRFYARLAEGGYVVCIQNFRGAQLSQGQWTGYRSLGLGKLKDGYDAVEWLAAQSWSTGKVGDLTYPDNAKFDKEAHMMRWFDHYLKGIDNGVEKDPTVQYYVMGALDEPGAPGNQWRIATDWPLKVKQTAFYLHEDKSLSREKPQQAKLATTFKADPLHPQEIPGLSFPGARDARSFEKQPEVRTFTTDVLTEPVEWTGKVRTELLVSSTARDTDFIVRVCDVYPDGRSVLIVDSILRARYREGFEKEVLMKPGKIYKLSFDVGWLSQIFNRGHRIRVTVASTGAPFYEPNPNTGEPLTIEFPSETVVAENTIYLNRDHSSRILAPVRTN